MRKAALGPAHLDTIAAMNNYAISLSKLGRQEEALPIRREVWDLWKAALGPAHLSTITAMSNYAVSLSKLGRAEEALPIKREVWDLLKVALGPTHLHTITAMDNYAMSLCNLGREEEALPILGMCFTSVSRAYLIALPGRCANWQLQSAKPRQPRMGVCDAWPAGCAAVHHAGCQSVFLPRKIGELELDFENPTWESNWDFEEFIVNFIVNFTVRFTINFHIYNITPKI